MLPTLNANFAMRRNPGSNRYPPLAEKSTQARVASWPDSVLYDRDPRSRIDNPAANLIKNDTRSTWTFQS